MIVGNPKVGRTLLTISVAVIGLLLIIAVLVGLRKRTAPQKEPPLHPASLLGRLSPREDSLLRQKSDLLISASFEKSWREDACAPSRSQLRLRAWTCPCPRFVAGHLHLFHPLLR